MIVPGRMSAEIEGDFVVFLIGARVNRLWKLPKYAWFMTAMPKMIKELEARPESGFLGWQALGPFNMVQYWRSLPQLVAYARAKDATHFPNWVRFNRDIGQNGDIGIWHETYLVKAGQYEAIYGNMPPFGLGKITTTIAAEGQQRTAQGRLGLTQGEDAPVPFKGA